MKFAECGYSLLILQLWTLDLSLSQSHKTLKAKTRAIYLTSSSDSSTMIMHIILINLKFSLLCISSYHFTERFRSIYQHLCFKETVAIDFVWPEVASTGASRCFSFYTYIGINFCCSNIGVQKSRPMKERANLDGGRVKYRNKLAMRSCYFGFG